MGMNASAVVVYGINIGECVPWDDEEHPDYDKDGKWWDMMDYYIYKQVGAKVWDKMEKYSDPIYKALIADAGIEDGHTGYQYDGDRYICIKDIGVHGDWCGITPIEPEKLRETDRKRWNEKLKDFCEVTGIEYTQPQWLLAVSYG